MSGYSFLAKYLNRSLAADEHRLPMLESVAHMVWDGSHKRDAVRDQLAVVFRQRGIEAPLLMVERLMVVMAELSGQSLGCAHLSHRMGLPPKEVLAMLAAAELAGIWRHVRSFDNEDSEIEDKSKGYLCDAGLVAELLGVQDPSQLDTHHSWGAIFETFIVDRIAGALPAEAQLFYWRTADGFAEVDVIIFYREWLYPIEIKSAVHASLSNAKKIAIFNHIYAGRYHRAPGLIVYAGDRYYRLDDQVFAVPSAML